MRRTLTILAIFLGFALADANAALPEAPPSTLGFDAERLARIDDVVRAAIEKKAVPGAVVLVGRRGKIAYAKAFGKRSIVPDEEAMTRDTLFDLASLTKPVATATSVLILVERGKLRLDDRLGNVLPEFANHGKAGITIEQLLRHRAGLVADNDIADYADGPETAWKRLAELPTKDAPGSAYLYSDVGFQILGRVVERVSGKTLDAFARDEIFGPLAMADTAFLPADKPRAAPTEPADGRMLRGEVHDPRSRALGGVAGHAGLFGTADDLAVFAQTLLDGGVGPNGRRILAPITVDAMADPGTTPDKQRRGLGWDVDTGQSVPRGAFFGKGGFGHTGFTGTSLWVDRPSGTFVVALTSRLHPDGKAPSPSALRYEVASVIAASVVDVVPGSRTATPPPPSAVRVLCGVDVLARDGFSPLKGRKVGLVTNHTGRTREGVSTIDALFKAPGVTLKALFSPEHGIRGEVDREVDDGRDEATGLPVYSLYGKTRKPTPESLDGLDALVYDVQDVGARFYTYISTLGLVLEAAKEKGIPLFVLDRPNPIGGVEVAGPVRDPGFASFIAFEALPVRHGMTVGELATMFNATRKVGADLHVVRCEGWARADLYDRTNLLWVNPSPNMRSLTEAILYPGIGLLEASNLATGRGTDTPFERVGAPWIDPPRFAGALNALDLPGVRFVPVRFTPKERQYKGEDCGGVYIAVNERDRIEPVAVGLGLAHVLRVAYRDDWKPEGFLKMLANNAAYQAVLDGKSPAEVAEVARPALDDFRRLRQSFLLYP